MKHFQITVVLLSLLSLPVFSQNDPVTPARAKRGREAEQTPGAPVKRHHPRAAFPLFNVENLDPQFEAVMTEHEEEEVPLRARALTFDDEAVAAVEEGRQQALEEIQRLLFANAMRAFVIRGANPCGAAIGELGFSGF